MREGYRFVYFSTYMVEVVSTMVLFGLFEFSRSRFPLETARVFQFLYAAVFFFSPSCWTAQPRLSLAFEDRGPRPLLSFFFDCDSLFFLPFSPSVFVRD